MSNRFVCMPTIVKTSDITFHKKSEYPNINFDNQEQIAYSYFFKETPNSNLHQITIISEYTYTSKYSDYFCRFDIHSPFEINKYINDLTKEDFDKLSKYHIQNTQQTINIETLDFPDSVSIQIENDHYNEEYLSLMLVEYRKIKNQALN